MTCIVALEHDGKAYLGSDSFLGSALIKDQTDRPKFFKKGEGFYVAFAGGLRGAQIIEHGISFRKMRSNETEEAYLVTEVASKLQQQFTKAGANIKSEDSVDHHDADFIICLNGKVFSLQDDYSVCRSNHGFVAVGAGQDFALGCLAAIYHTKQDPKKKIQRALEIAAAFSPQVCGPFHVIEV